MSPARPRESGVATAADLVVRRTESFCLGRKG